MEIRELLLQSTTTPATILPGIIRGSALHAMNATASWNRNEESEFKAVSLRVLWTSTSRAPHGGS